MAFAIVKAKMYGIQTGAPQRSKGIQVVELELTGANTDIDLDLGDPTGTFWTDAASSSPNCYAAVHSILTNIGANALSFIDVRGAALAAYAQAAVASTSGVTVINSAASAGGNATETMTVTGLLTTDTIVSVDQFVKGAGTYTGPVAFGNASGNAAANNALSVTFDADPGAGAKVKVAVVRSAAGALGTGQYSVAMQNGLPNLTFKSGDAPTSYKLCLTWLCGQSFKPIVNDFEE